MASSTTPLDYHVPRMDCESRVQDVVRMVAKLPGARKIEADARAQHLRLELDETRTSRSVLENNLLLLGYAARPFPEVLPAPGCLLPEAARQDGLDRAQPDPIARRTVPANAAARDPADSAAARPPDNALTDQPSPAPPGGAWGNQPFLNTPPVHVRQPPPAVRPPHFPGSRRRPSLALLAILLFLAAGLTLWAAWTRIGGPNSPLLPWPAALRVAAGLALVAVLFSRWLSWGLGWALSWLVAGVFGDTLGRLLDRAAGVLLTAHPLAPLVRWPGGTRLAGAHLPDVLVLVGVVGLLLTLRRSPPEADRPQPTSPAPSGPFRK
ncbi:MULTISPECIES: heavy-metal-associated domain-containing protein [Deinococcus]|uniref:heavy-metal-associated domain-containing protein n=1 Tax=Deinococcus TaxID=1298 RepID=UPI001268EF1D|nr:MULTISPECIES: heavy-metal-associated domain-containing protein [Deinococcus]